MEPDQEYKDAVLAICRSGYTVPSSINREALELLLKRTGLSLRDAVAIEDEVFSAFRRYEKELVEQGLKQYPLNAHAKQQLKQLQQILNLTDPDLSELNTYVSRFLASQRRTGYIGTAGCLMLLEGVVLFLLVPLLFMSMGLTGEMATLMFITFALIGLGFILSLANYNRATYDSYMKMRYGDNWKP